MRKMFKLQTIRMKSNTFQFTRITKYLNINLHKVRVHTAATDARFQMINRNNTLNNKL